MCLHHSGWAASGRIYTTEACAAPGGVYATGAWAASGHVYTKEACAAPGGVYTTGPEQHKVSTPHGLELHLYVSTLQSPVLLLKVPTPLGLSCIWTCLLIRYRGMCCSWRSSKPQGPELHLDVSTLQRPVLLLEVSTPQAPELHLDMSTLQRPVLLLEVSSPQGLSSKRCLHHRGLSCIWTCLH
jgi:hypothetical protein